MNKSHIWLLPTAIAACMFMGSCGKSNPSPIAINTSSKDIPATNAGVATISTGNSAGSAAGTATTGAGTGTSTGTTTGGTGTTTGGTGGTTGTTGGTGSGTTTGSGGSGSSTIGPTPTTPVSATGNNGVAIGAANTIIVKVNNKTYTFTQSAGDIVGCAVIPATPPFFPDPIVTINALDKSQTMQLSIQVEHQSPGIYTIKLMDFKFSEGEYNTMFASGGNINFNTFSVSNSIGKTKGTFDTYLGSASFGGGGPDSVRVSGSFNL